jgi:hypothetical protein
MAEHPLDRFELVLRLHGWKIASPGHLTKGEWQILYDTSTWMILETASNPRTSDVAVPDRYRTGWTVNLIEHLARIEDERARLRAALAAIHDDQAAGPSARSAASAALADCYHKWLSIGTHDECAICGARRQRSARERALESIATVRSMLWAVTRDDVRQALADHLDRAESDLSDHPDRSAEEMLAFRHELQANPPDAIPEPVVDSMMPHVNFLGSMRRADT